MPQDMLDIVDVEGKREPGKYPTKQGGFDLIWDNGPVSQFDKPTSLPTMLGCFNYRDQNQLRKSLAELAAEDAAQQQQQQGPGGGGSSTARLRKSTGSVAAAAGEGSRQGLAASAACQLGL
jgi:hypothetical protein